MVPEISESSSLSGLDLLLRLLSCYSSEVPPRVHCMTVRKNPFARRSPFLKSFGNRRPNVFEIPQATI